MANYNFKEDLLIGEDGENVVIENLKSFGGKFVSKNKNNKFDVKMEFKKENILYEIKTDVFCSPKYDTGNIFVEYECRGKPSGIDVTKAKWFVTYFKHFNEIWYIKTQDLKNLIDELQVTKTEGGDAGSNTKGYLIPRYQYEERFKIKYL